jgi:hypothetical protein
MSRVRRIEVTVGLAPQDFTQNMEAITVLSGFIELPSVQTTSNES